MVLQSTKNLHDIEEYWLVIFPSVDTSTTQDKKKYLQFSFSKRHAILTLGSNWSWERSWSAASILQTCGFLWVNISKMKSKCNQLSWIKKND